MTNNLLLVTKRRRSEDGSISKTIKSEKRADLDELLPCPNATTSNKEEIQTNLQSETTTKGWWHQMTNDLVHLSTFPFLILSVPQLIRNVFNIQAGNLAALSILSWKGFMTALVGNSILLSYFLIKKEKGAALVQAIGVISNFSLLFQIYACGLLNRGVFWVTACFVIISALVNGTVLSGMLDVKNSPRVVFIGRLWEGFLSVLGLSLFVQALWSTILPQVSLLPALVTALFSIIIDILKSNRKLSPAYEEAWSGVSAWTATCLFAFQPIGQLVCNFTDPSSLRGLSLGTILLAMTGNGLMVPRALRTRDKIWLTGQDTQIYIYLLISLCEIGTLWSSLMMGWAQLLCLYLAGLRTGLDYLSPALFYFFTLCQALYFIFIFTTEARISNLRHPLAPIVKTYFP